MRALYFLPIVLALFVGCSEPGELVRAASPSATVPSPLDPGDIGRLPEESSLEPPTDPIVNPAPAGSDEDQDREVITRPAPSEAQAPQPPQAPQTQPPANTQGAAPDANYGAYIEDLDTISFLYRSNLKNIELGRIAEDRGQSSWVRSFGKRLRRDSELANRRLIQLTEDRGIAFAAQANLSEEEIRNLLRQRGGLPDTAHLEKIQGLVGPQLDRELIIQARAVNEDILQTMRALHAVMPRASDLHAYVSRLQPIMEQHSMVANRVMTRHIEETNI